MKNKTKNMRITKSLTIIGSLIILAACCGDAGHMSQRMVDSQMTRCETAFHLDFQEGNPSWNYTPGLELKAYLDVYQTYGGDAILEYVDNWYDPFIAEDGSIERYCGEKYSVDKICPARTIFQLYDITGKEKYRAALDYMYQRFLDHPRTSEGALWHKSIYPFQIWLDGLYMAQPFHAEYAARFLAGEPQAEAFDGVVNDFLVAARHTFDPQTKLYRHAWDETRSMFWCDPETGQSAHCWGRALGWYCMALVDVLDFIPENADGRQEMIDIFRGIVEVLPSFADAESGMWYQVLDQPGREGNYLEATCSAMFVYSMLKGIRCGWLDEELLPYAKECYGRLVDTFISTDERGLISIDNCCSVGGLGGKQMRKGDYAYYLSEPVRSNDSKGVGPFIWASLEFEKINQ